jgi:hypothetical protein
VSQALLAQSGAQPQKQPKYVPIHFSRAQYGLVTNRAALHNPSIGIYGDFYGAGKDVLLAGSNIEVSPQQTWKHRPGCSAFATLPSKCLTSYPYFNPDGSITLYMDTVTGVYTNPSSPALFFTKSAGAGQTSFLQIGNTLYMANGVDNKKVIGGKIYNWASNGPQTAPIVVIDSVGSGASASVPWAASTVFTTMGLLKDTNNNIQQLISVNADGTNTTSTVIGTSGVGEPVWNNTSGGTVTEASGLQWECFGPVGVWQPTTTYTDASSPGTLANPSVIFDGTSGNIFIFNGNGAGSGASGVTRPNFSGVPLLGHVGDNGFKWFNIGPAKTWKPATHFNQYGSASGANDPGAFIIEPTTPQAAGYGTINQQTVFFQVVITVGGGNSDASHTGPQWATTQAKPVTRDGQLNFQFLGSAVRANLTTYTAWQAGTPFFNVIDDGTNLQVCLVGGISAAGAPTFQTTYGAITNDGSVQWVCVGPKLSWAASTKWFLPASGFTPPVSGVNPYGGSAIIDSNSNVEFVTSSGKSGLTAPVWATTVGATTTDSGITWTLTALASTFKGSTALAFTKGYGYVYAWKSRSATDFYVNNAPNGQSGGLGPPIGSGSGGITTASPVFKMPVGANAGAIMQISGQWPTDTQYDTVCIFRSTDGFQSGPYLELTEIAAPTPVNGVYQGTWTFYDSIPDIQLNELVEGDVDGLNAPPPTGLTNLELHMNRIWGNVGNIVYASSGPDIPVANGNGYEGWSASNTFPLQSPVNKHIATQSGLLAFTTSDVYIIAGGPSIPQFFPWRIARGIGLLSTNAIQIVGGEIYMVTADKRFIAFQPGIGHSEPGFPIADQIATFTPSSVYITEHASGQDPSAMYVCDGSTGWFRLVPHAAPGFVSTDQPVWSPFATITGGCTGVQSVTTAPGVRSLLIYQSGGVILKRDLTTAQDSGSNFSGNYTIGSIILAQPGQLAELGFVTFEFANQGSPTAGFLLDEISGSFHQFTSFRYDPPDRYGNTGTPTSYSPQRFEFKQTVDTNQLPPFLGVRHLQLKVSYPSENFFHELYSFCIDGALHAEL